MHGRRLGAHGKRFHVPAMKLNQLRVPMWLQRAHSEWHKQKVAGQHAGMHMQQHPGRHEHVHEHEGQPERRKRKHAKLTRKE